jgi:hypothetical protein
MRARKLSVAGHEKRPVKRLGALHANRNDIARIVNEIGHLSALNLLKYAVRFPRCPPQR